MGIQSFLKAKKGDPDWAFTPDQYFDKEFKIVDASLLELGPNKTEYMVLRQSPNERELLAKHIKIDVREGASLDLTIINDAFDKLQQVFIYDIILRDGATLNMGMFIKGGKLNKHIFEVTLDDLATFNSYGYIMSRSGGDCEIITKIDHQGSYSASNQMISCEAGSKSQTVVHCMSSVAEHSRHTQISMDLANLITEPGGKCHSIPESYNVTESARINCITSTDYLDAEKIYYLQTRGMSEIAAREMLIGKHRGKIIGSTSDPDLVQEIEQLFD
jgi:Fe-S cluster assembly scaffold protein SufB